MVRPLSILQSILSHPKYDRFSSDLNLNFNDISSSIRDLAFDGQYIINTKSNTSFLSSFSNFGSSEMNISYFDRLDHESYTFIFKCKKQDKCVDSIMSMLNSENILSVEPNKYITYDSF